MTATDEASLTRVASRDGTEIACWTTGDGTPPLVLVHGTTADHTRWRPLLPYLQPHATVHAIDRRGRGGSGDAPDYHLAREFEDVAAVVDAVATACGSAVDLLGHSYGGVCASGAAALTPNLRRLVLYEGWPARAADASTFLPSATLQRMDALLAAGEREAVLEIFVRDILQMTEAELAVYRALPAWPARIAAVHTITRELRAAFGAVFDPAEAAKITVPTLMLVGADSPEHIKGDYHAVAAALPDARITVLEDQQHIAMDLIPEAFAAHVLGFLRD